MGRRRRLPVRIPKYRQKFKSPYHRLQKILSSSMSIKKKAGWSRDVGAGFIKNDIKSVVLYPDNSFKIVFKWDHEQKFKAGDLNLRETEELLKWVKERIWRLSKPQ